MFILQTHISIAELVDVQMGELGSNIFQMSQFIGDINDDKSRGLESIFNLMNENFFCKDDPAINEHNYQIIQKQYNE